jgi:osmotically-inducible protein OsmY
VQNRVVYLSGKTVTLEEQQRALTVARGADGVKVVVNDMWLNNLSLVDKVRQALAADDKVGKIPIDVDANGTTVRLMSDQTNSEERARAVEIATAVEGVSQVEDRMR